MNSKGNIDIFFEKKKKIGNVGRMCVYTWAKKSRA